MKKSRIRSLTAKRVAVFANIVVLMVGAMVPLTVQAAQLDDRELTLEDSQALAETGHNYSFVIATSGDVGEMQFEYCNNNPFPGQSCTAPSGLDVSTNITLDSVLVNGSTPTNSYSIDGTNSTSNKIVIDTGTANTLSAGDVVDVDFSGAVNPDSSNTEFFTRLYTYQSDSGSTLVDDGGLAFSTAETIDVTARVEENLVFCIYGSSTDSCADPGTTSIDLGVLTTASGKTGTHRALVATNALNGFTVQYAGTTLNHDSTSADITAITGTGEGSNPGNEQFGMHISVANSPSTLASLNNEYSNTDCSAGGGTGTGSIKCYAFVDGATVTDGEEQTQDGGTNPDNTLAYGTGPVDQNNFSIEYLGNVEATTETGTYSTTVTYVATATF